MSKIDLKSETLRKTRKPGRPKGVKATNIAGEITRELLINTAMELFSQKGFSGASIGDVSTVSGVAKGSITHHFKDKRKLYGAVLDRVAKQLLISVEAAFDETLSHGQKLDALIDGLLSWGQEAPGHVRLLNYDILELPHRSEMPKNWVLGQHLQRAEKLIDDAKDEGVIVQDVSAVTLLEMMFGVVSFHTISSPFSPYLVSRPHELDRSHYHAEVRGLMQQMLYGAPHER
jgi:AcrR family transcriptional regulator